MFVKALREGIKYKNTVEILGESITPVEADNIVKVYDRLTPDNRTKLMRLTIKDMKNICGEVLNKAGAKK